MREIREIVRQRAYLVRMRTRLKNKIHAELAKRWIKPEKNIFTMKGKEWLRSLDIESINRYLDIMETLDEEINEMFSRISSIAKENEDAKLLTFLWRTHSYLLPSHMQTAKDLIIGWLFWVKC